MTKNTPAKQVESGFSIVDNPQSAQTISAAFTEFNLTAADLTRLKIPAGGSIAWEVETLGETKPRVLMTLQETTHLRASLLMA
jgi:hypothetical protein